MRKCPDCGKRIENCDECGCKFKKGDRVFCNTDGFAKHECKDCYVPAEEGEVE